MSRLICMNCKIFLDNDHPDIELCPYCGSSDLELFLAISDHIELHENAKGKTNKRPGKKKPYSEFQVGEELSVATGDFVNKVRRIDRENDLYYERVVDPKSGKVLHECCEPLSQHYGHGSDKSRKKE